MSSRTDPDPTNKHHQEPELPTPTPPALLVSHLSLRPRTNNTKNDKMLIKVRTLTGKEIELDIEPDYRVSR
jgi:hypothetical protein